MPNESHDFWPDIRSDVRSPAMILNEQAEALLKKTRGVIQPDLLEECSRGIVKLYFDIVAPAANNYRQRVLTVRQKESGTYPAVITASSLSQFNGHGKYKYRLAKFVEWEMADAEGICSYLTQDPEEFDNLTAMVLQSVSVRTSLISLLAKSNEAKTKLTRFRSRSD